MTTGKTAYEARYAAKEYYWGICRTGRSTGSMRSSLKTGAAGSRTFTVWI